MAESEIELSLDAATGGPVVHNGPLEADNHYKAQHTTDNETASVASSNEEYSPVNVDEKHSHHNGKNVVCVHNGPFHADMNPYKAHIVDNDTANVASTNEEDLPVHIDDGHGEPPHYPGEDEKQALHKDEVSANQEHPRSAIAAAIEVIKYLYSFGLLVFSIVVVMAAIFTEQTSGTADNGIPTYVAFLVFWFLIAWLAMMEGGQGALVGLQPIDKSLYAESHPRALKITTLAHKGNNMERFIVGRQFLVVLVFFVINWVASSVPGASVLGMPTIVNDIFLASGIAVILITIMLGQLTAQVNSANCMLDFINNYFMLFTTYVSLAIEFSGLLHCVYLVQIFFSKVTDTPIESKEQPRTAVQNLFFWARVLMSLAILGFAFAVTLTALFEGKTTMWNGVPEAVSVIIFFILMCFVGMMEGMQIALFAVVNLPEEEFQDHTIAYANCKLTFAGQNLQAFLIGRQICVTICTFVIARITTLNIVTGTGENIFGVSDGLQSFFNTGLLGAVITTIVASLAWRIIASSFPVAYLSNPLIYVIIRLCLILEASGVCSAAWLLALVQKRLACYQPDEVYIGTPEKRAEASKDGDEELGNDLALKEEEVSEPKSASQSMEVDTTP